MISRTLGPEFGGSIGTLFFLANVVGSALAISGCVEGIVENLGPAGYYGGAEGVIPDGRWWRFLYCTLVNILMLVVCLVGASLFAKTSVLILGIVIVSLFSTFISFLTQNAMMVTFVFWFMWHVFVSPVIGSIVIPFSISYAQLRCVLLHSTESAIMLPMTVAVLSPKLHTFCFVEHLMLSHVFKNVTYKFKNRSRYQRRTH